MHLKGADAMAIEVFNRREIKYLLRAETACQVIQRISEEMKPDTNNPNGETYTIINIYYDTPDSYLIRTSLSKPIYKEKLRLRSYGIPDMDRLVYIEIKKKFKGIVNKRRSAIKLDEAYQFVDSGVIPEIQPYMNKQVLKEITYLLSRLNLSPKVCIAYDRLAFHDEEQRDLRVSFDMNIRTRRTDLRLESGDDGQNLLNAGEVVMEIKAMKVMPVWLRKLLSEHKIYSDSFSKYGREYLQNTALQYEVDLNRI